MSTTVLTKLTAEQQAEILKLANENINETPYFRLLNVVEDLRSEAFANGVSDFIRNTFGEDPEDFHEIYDSIMTQMTNLEHVTFGLHRDF